MKWLDRLLSWFPAAGLDDESDEPEESFKPARKSRMTEEAAVKRAERAAELLNDEVMVDAFEALEAAITQKWSCSEIRDLEGQHELRLMLKASRDFRRVLTGYIQDGKIVLHKARIEEQKERHRAALTKRHAA